MTVGGDIVVCEPYEAEQYGHPIACYQNDGFIAVTQFNLEILEVWQRLTELFTVKVGVATYILQKYVDDRQITPLEFDQLFNGMCIIESVFEEHRAREEQAINKRAQKQYDGILGKAKMRR